MNEWIKKTWYIETAGFYSVVKEKNEIMISEGKQIELKIVSQ